MNKIFFSIIAVLILNPSLSNAFTVEGDGYEYDTFCKGFGELPAIENAIDDAHKKAENICKLGKPIYENYKLISVRPIQCKTWNGGFKAKVSFEVDCNFVCKPGICGDW